MNNLFSEFKAVSKEEWQNKLIADLKGKDPALLTIHNEIEEIEFPSYFHKEDEIDRALPGNLPYTRGVNKPLNNWSNGSYLLVQNETESNKKALAALMGGADLLVFESAKESINWKALFEGIQTAYIKTIIKTSNINDIESIKNEIGLTNFIFHFDLFSNDLSDTDWRTLTDELKIEQRPVLQVNGRAVQQAGATTWQEVAFCLNLGHEYLLKLMDSGLTIDEAAACISFSVGLGSNYFLETLKIRVLRNLWSDVIDAYQPEHECSHYCSITAETGHLNKSLKDPYTNLLRQTTEAMSAINAGVDHLLITAYDLHSKNGPSALAERMALNISNILKEESYFDKVIDATGGSYALEQIMEIIKDKAWHKFIELEKNNGLFDDNCWEELQLEIRTKAQQRITALTEEKSILIGVNKYPNSDEAENDWLIPETYKGLAPLVLEVELKKIAL